jgi:nucleotide-binding universal stress UspA family protein
MRIGSRHRDVATFAPAASGARPVMLVTFDVPVLADAASLAVDTAVESGQPLIVVNVVELPIRPMTASWGNEVVVMEDVDRSLQGPAELARSLRVEVERLRVVSPRPLTALLELVGERAPGLLVVGPDPSRLRKRAYRKIARRIRDEAPCLVWLAAA